MRVKPMEAWDARPAEIVGMKALQLHQVMSATVAIRRPLTVMARYAGVNSSDKRGAAAEAAALFHRSGSLTNIMTRNASAAGTRPNRNTYRHATSGLPLK